MSKQEKAQNKKPELKFTLTDKAKTFVETFTAAYDHLNNNAKESNTTAYVLSIVPTAEDSQETLEYDIHMVDLPLTPIFNSVRDNLFDFKEKVAKGKNDVDNFNVYNKDSIFDFINCSEDDDNSKKVKRLLTKISVCPNADLLNSDLKKSRHVVIVFKDKDYQITLIFKGRPVVSSSKRRSFMYFTDQEKVTRFQKLEGNIFNIPLSAVSIIIRTAQRHDCYILAADAEEVFGFEAVNRKICMETLKIFESKFKSPQATLLSEYSLKGTRYNKYATYDKTRFKALLNPTEKQKTALAQHGITYNGKELVLETTDNAARIVNFLCKKLLIDLWDGKVKTADNPKDIEADV